MPSSNRAGCARTRGKTAGNLDVQEAKIFPSFLGINAALRSNFFLQWDIVVIQGEYKLCLIFRNFRTVRLKKVA